MASLLHFPSLCFSSPSYANIPTIHLSPPISSSSTSVSTTSNAFNFSSVLTRQKPQILGFCTRGIRRVPGNPNLPVRLQRIITTGPESQSQVKKREPMIPPYNVLITGSTKGIGYALAKEFLKSGDNVIICSRSAERVESAVQNLNEEFGAQRVSGTVCDVRKGDEIKKLVTFARDKLKYIDIWINNAGSNAYSYKPLSEASDEDLIEVVTTNSLGLMICCREAITMMSNQSRGGHIFNIDGAGSDGRPTPRFAAYGATKRSVVHLTKSLQAELQMQEVKNVMVHNLSPGMVTTELLMSGALTKQAKFFINVLAEPAEVVAEYLVTGIRSIPRSGSMKPTYIRFLTGLKAYSQIFSRLAFGARRNRYLIED